MQRGVLQQHDGLGVADAAVGDHRQRVVEREFERFDVLALGGEAAFGFSPGPFRNYLAGARFDRRFRDDVSMGLGVYYANLKGKDGRAHNVLPWALFEYRIDLGADWAVPLRFASGYLPKNGPVVKVAAGVSLPLGQDLELSTELLNLTTWVTHERAVVSADVAAALGITF